MIEYACIKYTKIKGLDSKKIASLPKSKDVMKRMLITRLAHLNKTPDQLPSPSKFAHETFD